MQTLTVTEAQNGKPVDGIIRHTFPGLPVNALYKALRKKDIKINGTRIRDICRVYSGDRIDIYIADKILQGDPLAGMVPNRGFVPVYEDCNILIVNKEQGIPVHPDRDRQDNTLINRVHDYLAQKGEFVPGKPGSFTPALCHRLDRNTGGLIIIAKNSTVLDIILNKIKSREIKKFYQCLAYGKMPFRSAELRAFLLKNEQKSRVFIYDSRVKDSLEIITRYRVLNYKSDISRLEIELVTGRTHQIRAHLAHIGHPVIGDGKYGSNSINRSAGLKQQALWACRLEFDFVTPSGVLNYLKGKVFEADPDWSQPVELH